MQKTVEIIVGQKLERPPLNTCCRYYRLYLPDEIAIDTNQCKDINLNFKIKLPDNVAAILFQTHYSINSRWRLLINLYKQLIDTKKLLSNFSTKQNISVSNFQIIQKLQDFIFLLHPEKTIIQSASKINNGKLF